MIAEVRSDPLGLVNGVVEGIMRVASKHLKKNGASKLAGMMNMEFQSHEISVVSHGIVSLSYSS